MIIVCRDRGDFTMLVSITTITEVVASLPLGHYTKNCSGKLRLKETDSCLKGAFYLSSRCKEFENPPFLSVNDSLYY